MSRLAFSVAASLSISCCALAPAIAVDESVGAAKNEAAQPMIRMHTAKTPDPTLTEDQLLIDESKKPKVAFPEAVASGVKLIVDAKAVKSGRLSGVKVTIQNDTTEPILVLGEAAKIAQSGKNTPCMSLADLERSILPGHGIEAIAKEIAATTVPAAFTVGASLPVKDLEDLNGPPEKRYGLDETRRILEASRLGRRIVWPKGKTQGVIYFSSSESVGGGQMQLPITPILDKEPIITLTGSVATQ